MSRTLGSIDNALGGMPSRALGKLDRALGATSSRSLGRTGSRFAKQAVAVAAALLVAGFAFSVLVGPAAADTKIDSCNEVVSTSDDFKLDANLVCGGVGIKITADDVTLDLDGHTLSWDGTGTGDIIGIYVVGVDADRFEITGEGVVAGWPTGIRIEKADRGKIEGVTLMENDIGIDLVTGADDNKVKNNVVGVSDVGIKVRGNSDKNLVEGNTVFDSSDGIMVDNSDRTEILSNFLAVTNEAIHLNKADKTDVFFNQIIGGSGAIGVRVHAGSDDNEIEFNVIANHDTGVKVGVALSSEDNNDNEINENVILNFADFGIFVGPGNVGTDINDNTTFTDEDGPDDILGNADDPVDILDQSG